MEQEHEFIDGRYNKAVIGLKASLFDIVELENNKTKKLTNQMEQETNQELKAELSKQIEEQKQTLDHILANTDEIIKDIELLDSRNTELTNFKANEIGNKVLQIEDESINNTLKQDLEENNKEQAEINEETEQKIDEVVEQGNVTEEEKTSSEPVLNIETENKNQDPTNNNENNKLAFTKSTKNITKAILVKQNQLENLKSSVEKQEKTLETLGLFEGYNYFENTKKALSTSLEKEKNLEAELKLVETPTDPDQIDRLIEDYTVKANIYNSEGETEKAQILFAKIEELKKQNNIENEDIKTNVKTIQKNQ